MVDPVRYSMIPQLVDNGVKRKQFDEIDRINEWLPYAYIFAREWKHDGLRNYCYTLASANKFRLDPAAKYLFGFSDDKSSAYSTNKYITLYAIWNVRKNVRVSDKMKLGGLVFMLNGLVGQHDDVLADLNDIVTAYTFLSLIGLTEEENEIMRRLREEAEKILEMIGNGYEVAVARWRLFGELSSELEPKHFINDVRLWIMSKQAYEYARRKF